MQRIVSTLALGLFAWTISGCGQDLSNGRNFPAFAGTTWKTKVPMVLVRDGSSTIGYECNHDQELEFARGTLTWREHGKQSRPVAIVPVGTIIRIERLMESAGDSGSLYVMVSIQNGPNNGTSIVAPNYFFAENRWLHVNQSLPDTWAPAPEKLEKP